MFLSLSSLNLGKKNSKLDNPSQIEMVGSFTDHNRKFPNKKSSSFWILWKPWFKNALLCEHKPRVEIGTHQFMTIEWCSKLQKGVYLDIVFHNHAIWNGLFIYIHGSPTQEVSLFQEIVYYMNDRPPSNKLIKLYEILYSRKTM